MKNALAVTIKLTFWYIDDVLSINNNNFHETFKTQIIFSMC